MKRLAVLFFTVLCTLGAFAQQDVTKFLGIPVDGFKKDMIRKLEAKGFEYNSITEELSGEFNGQDVKLHVVTNNNKVYRIVVFDANYTNETNIKIRFNTLCGQFARNNRYYDLVDYTIPESDDISYEMTVNSKRYEADFYQKPSDPNGGLDLNKSVWFMIDERYGDYRIIMFYDNEYNHADGEDL